MNEIKKDAGGKNNLLALYSFILTVIVIWIHSADKLITGEAYSAFTGFFSETLGQMAVPGFFIISGYLFFRKYDHGQNNSASQKGEARFFLRQWQKRSRTVLIPYLLWNLIYFLLYLALGRTRLSLETFIDAVLYYRYNPVFWYIYQLIILLLLSPLVYALIKIRKAAPLSLAALYLLAVFYQRAPFHIVNEDALFYYTFGAAAGLYLTGYIEKNDISGIENRDTVKKDVAGLLISLALTAAFYFEERTAYPLFGVIGMRVTMNTALFFLLRMCCDENTKILPFMVPVFFTYALHYLEIRGIRLLWYVLKGRSLSGMLLSAETGNAGTLPQTASAGDFILFLLMPALCIASSYIISLIMKKIIPSAYKLLTGGR